MLTPLSHRTPTGGGAGAGSCCACVGRGIAVTRAPARAAITLDRFVINIETSPQAPWLGQARHHRLLGKRPASPADCEEGVPELIANAVTRCLSSHCRPACYTR